MWWWTYSFHIKDCTSGLRGYARTEFMRDAQFPIGFEWGNVSPLLGGNFASWRDSVANALRPDQTLMVTGVAYRDEVSALDVMHLARARARAVSRLLEDNLSRRQVQLNGKIGVVKSDIKDQVFPGFELRTLTRNASVRQSEDCTLLYYPIDTSGTAASAEVTQFLSNLTRELQGSSIITILPAVFVVESDTASVKLQAWRLRQIRDAIVNSGYTADLVVTSLRRDTTMDSCLEDLVEDNVSWVLLMVK